MKTKSIFSVLTLIACLFSPIFSSAQSDSLANGYGTGSFDHRIIFSVIGGQDTLTSAGGKDILVLRYDSLGNLAWARQAGGASNDAGVDAVVDDSGNVYVTGYFSGTARFGRFKLTSADVEDFFLAKYDKNGNVMWVTRAGGEGRDAGQRIVLDEYGNLRVTEYITGYVFVDGKEIKKGADGTVVAVYSTDGALLSVE